MGMTFASDHTKTAKMIFAHRIVAQYPPMYGKHVLAALCDVLFFHAMLPAFYFWQQQNWFWDPALLFFVRSAECVIAALLLTFAIFFKIGSPLLWKMGTINVALSHLIQCYQPLPSADCHADL